jgi:hypothetical protein
VESAGGRGVRRKPGKLGLGGGGRPGGQVARRVATREARARRVGKTKCRETSRGALLAQSRPVILPDLQLVLPRTDYLRPGPTPIGPMLGKELLLVRKQFFFRKV